MRYVYECCERFEVVKSVTYLDRVEPCPICCRPATRILTVPLRYKSSFTPHYNYGLGKAINSPRDIKDAIKKANYEQGREIIEVGNDSQSKAHGKELVSAPKVPNEGFGWL